ncbi:ATP-binding protein [Kibdelosporangium aridum]|uniref:ATP-binding protein n=1 Tax=Kibdelosporangium aridum TaxID=2030 RepID=UPI0035EC49B5
MDLYGRQDEKRALDQVLDQARAGTGTGLVLWGDPGIGKTTLLEYATEAAAPEFTVLSCRGTRLESGLAFAGIHELLWPVMDRVASLPQPQGNALRGALGYVAAPADRFLVGAAVLALVCELAEKQPVLIVVDDAQWLDDASAQCLAFVARRSRTVRSAFLLAMYEDPTESAWDWLPAMEIQGLADDDARLLAATAAPDLDEAIIRRAVRVAGGNPLALKELPLTVPGEQIAVGPRLRHAFNARIEGLGASTRTLLLLAAAEDRGDRKALRQAADALGIGEAAWDEALRSGLLNARDDRVRFRHPLIRAVVYEDAPFSERRAVHRVLAHVLTGKDAEELGAWHLASAADEADEQVAGLLEKSASRAWTRGGCATAARALRRAAELSPAPVDAARRLAHAAKAAWEAGQVDVARELLSRAERLVGEATVGELSDGLRGLIEFAHGDQERAYRYLTRDMRLVSDPDTAVELGAMAVRAGWSAGRATLQAEALRQLGTRADLLYEGPTLTDEALTRFGSGSWQLAPPAPLCVAWGVERLLSEALGRKIVELRRTDAVTALAAVLAQTVTLDIAQGDWTRAAANAVEGLRLAEEIGADHLASQCRNCLGWLAAVRGDEQAVVTTAARSLELSVPRGVRALTAAATWNVGMSALFAGRAKEAMEQLLRLTEADHDAAHPTFALLAAVDTVEAAVHAGQPEAAEPHERLLRDWAERTDAAWAVSAVHLTQALLTTGPEAEDAFRRALAVPGAAARPFVFARTRLLFGEWLRRARRRTDARAQLTEAAATFQRLGATPLLERALTEQELAGHQSRPHILTSQELRVARLAGAGLTNREIAAQLLISPRTVSHHLSNVFPKLGVVARAELSHIDFEGSLRLTR